MQKLKRAVVKEELVALTKDLESSIILNQFIYWSERINDFDKFIDEEKKRMENEGMESEHLEKQNGWIYKDLEELKSEIMFTCSTKTIARKLDMLVKNNWLDRRNNPKFRWDRTYQYRVNLYKIMNDLLEVGYILQDYKISLDVLKNSKRQFVPCISQEESLKSNTEETLENSKRQIVFSKSQNVASKVQNVAAITEITTEITTEISNSINQSNNKVKLNLDRLIDLDKQIKKANFKTYKELISDINLDEQFFEEKHKPFISSVKRAIFEMYYYDDTRIKNKIVSRYDIIDKLQKLNYDIIVSVIEKVIQVSKEQEIQYIVAFIKTTLFNEIDEFDAKVQTQVNYDLENYRFYES